MDHATWSFLAFVCGIAGYVPYNAAIMLRKTTPRLSGWLVWMVLDWFSLIGMGVKGEWNGVVIGFTIGATFTFWNAYAHSRNFSLKMVDWFCITTGIGCGMLWAFDGDPTRALVLMGIGLLVGAIPAMINAFNTPSGESVTAWTLFCASSLFGLFAMTEWSAAKAAVPVSLLVQTWVILFIIMTRRRALLTSSV